MLGRRGKAERLANSCIQDGGTSSGGCVHEAFRRKKFYALKVKKGLSALCHISQAGINTL